MGKLRKRVETESPEMSEADAIEIREWEAGIERDRQQGWQYRTTEVIEFDDPLIRCWADKEYIALGGRPYHTHCDNNEETDVGLCKEHYVEILGKDPDGANKRTT